MSDLPARFARAFGALTLAMNGVGTLGIFVLMFIICADVIGRYVFDAPIKGAAEMVGYAIVTAVFLQFASTLRVGRFTRVEILIDRLEATRPAAGLAIDAVFKVVGAAVFFAIAWGAWPKLEYAFASGEITGTPGVFTFVIWPFLAVIVAGAAVTGVEFAIQLARMVAGALAAWRRPPEGARAPGPALIGYAAGLLARLERGGIGNGFTVTSGDGRERLHRVRLGPLATSSEFDRVNADLRAIGIKDARLVTEN